MQLDWHWLAGYTGSADARFTAHICLCTNQICCHRCLNTCPFTRPSLNIPCLCLSKAVCLIMCIYSLVLFYASAVLWVPTMWNRITYFTLCRCMTTMPGSNCHSLFVGGFFAPHSLLTQHTGESLQAKFRASRILDLIISWVEWRAFSCTAESLRVVLYFCTDRWWFTFLCRGKDEA